MSDLDYTEGMKFGMEWAARILVDLSPKHPEVREAVTLLLELEDNDMFLRRLRDCVKERAMSSG